MNPLKRPAMTLSCAMLLAVGASAVDDGCPTCLDTTAANMSGSVPNFPCGLFTDCPVYVKHQVWRYGGGCFKPVQDPNDPLYDICLEAYPCTPRIRIWWETEATTASLRYSHTLCSVPGNGNSEEPEQIFDDFLEVNCGESCPINGTYSVMGGYTVFGTFTLTGTAACSGCNDTGLIQH